MKNELSIVIPTHNENENVRVLINELMRIFNSYNLKGEIIIVDDSTDKTKEILEEIVKSNKLVKVYYRKKIRKTSEIGIAVKIGIEKARYKYVCVMMGDLSDDPKDMLKMIKKIENGYDIVCGSRFIKNSHVKNYPFLKKIAHRFYNLFFSSLFNLHVSDFSNSFKMYKKNVFSKIEIESVGFEYSAEVIFKAKINGMKITEVPVSWSGRTHGESKLGSFSFSPKFLFCVLPKIGYRYTKVALKLYPIYLKSKLIKN